MLTSLRIIHPPTSDNPTLLPVLLLNIDSRRFLFNAPEGTTRAMVQRGARGSRSRLQGIFVPKAGYEECGGLPGLIMSLADQGKTELDIVGPPITRHLIATARGYARRELMNLSVHETAQGSKDRDAMHEVVYTDKDITIEAITLLPKGHNASRGTGERPNKKARSDEDYDGYGKENYSSGSASAAANGRQRSPSPLALSRVPRFNMLFPPRLKPVELTRAAASQAPALTFIVRGNEVRGRFDPVKANDLGVSLGSLFRPLSEGKDIDIDRPKEWATWDQSKREGWRKFHRSKSSKGKAKDKKEAELVKAQWEAVETEKVRIHSAQVLGKAVPASHMAQVYLPSIDYLPAFLAPSTQTTLTELQEGMHTIVHAVHEDVLDDPRYQAFIRSFPSTYHYITTPAFVPDKLSYPSFSLSMHRLSKINSKLFQVPRFSLKAKRALDQVGLAHDRIMPVPLDAEVVIQPRKPPTVKMSKIRDIDFPLRSPQMDKLASFPYAPAYETETANLQLGQQRWSKYLDLVAQLQEEEQQATASDRTVETNGDGSTGLQITTLGTGSALPSQHRNVSSTLVHLPHQAGYILLDAGEGTYGQLCRKFGDQVDTVLANIRVIFLSHYHGDHHMGMTRLLVARRRLQLSRPLYVVSNFATRHYLYEVNEVQPLDLCPPDMPLKKQTRGVIFLNTIHLDSWHGVRTDPLADQPTPVGQQQEAYDRYMVEEARTKVPRDGGKLPSDSTLTFMAQEVTALRQDDRETVRYHHDDLVASIDGCRLFTTEVQHRGGRCYGVVLRGRDWSLAYSGDTRPCRRLAQAGQGVEVLLHEATFANGQEEDALRKAHSTVGDAIQVARQMQARRLLLTHFSQRYPNLPNTQSTVELEEGKDTAPTDTLAVGISFDLMTVTPADIGKTERYREAMQVLFDAEGDVEGVEEEDGSDEKANVVGGPGGDRGQGGGGQGSGQNSAAGERAAPAPTSSSQMAPAERSTAKDQQVAPQAPSHGHQTDSAKPIIQRRYVKQHEHLYLTCQIVPVHLTSNVRATATTPPGRLQFDQAVQSALDALVGTVGSSFLRDLVSYLHLQQDPPTSFAGPYVRAVYRVASPYAQTLATVLADGVVIAASSSTDLTWTTRYVGVAGPGEVGNLLAMDTEAGRRNAASTASLLPPGRAWLRNMVQSTNP